MGRSPIRRILHWGPLLAMSIIGIITTCTIMCDLQWWPIHTPAGAINIIVFLSWNVLTLYNLFSAALTGPGSVPEGWRPKADDDLQYVQFCGQCESYKAPRSHHCRKCQSCVMKMDHHCPWINNCVGHFNHASFSYFLFFAPCGCTHALFILIPAMYRAVNRNYYYRHNIVNVPLVTMNFTQFLSSLIACSCALGVAIALGVLLFVQTYYIYYGSGQEPLVHLGIRGFISCMFAVGLSIGVVAALGGLLFMQIKSILKNETGIESWICDKAYYRAREEEEEEEFVYPYNLGRLENFKQVFHWTPRPELDGIFWPVREGCNQYSLTIEQIKQKKDKRDRSIVYHTQEAFSGSMCPLSKGPRVCCCPPCTDEPRLKISIGDRVMVTRWKKHWMYGDLLKSDDNYAANKKRARGWFPRRCAIEDLDTDMSPRYFGDVVQNDNGIPPPLVKKTQTEKKDD